MVARHKVSGAGIMRGLDFAKSGRYGTIIPSFSMVILNSFTFHVRRLVTNSSDRTLRQFNLPTYPPPNDAREYIEVELEPTHRFNDPISRAAWHAMSFSPDGEWLAGGS